MAVKCPGTLEDGIIDHHPMGDTSIACLLFAKDVSKHFMSIPAGPMAAMWPTTQCQQTRSVLNGGGTGALTAGAGGQADAASAWGGAGARGAAGEAWAGQLAAAGHRAAARLLHHQPWGSMHGPWNPTSPSCQCMGQARQSKYPLGQGDEANISGRAMGGGQRWPRGSGFAS
jgi:hypothetical protein